VKECRLQPGQTALGTHLQLIRRKASGLERIRSSSLPWFARPPNKVAALVEAWHYPPKRSKMINFARQVSDGRPRRGFWLNTVRSV
jgi:hypothetical protein